MKKSVTVLLLSIAMLLTISPINALESDNFTYEQALESVMIQLEEQDSMRFLPVYEEILKREFNISNNKALTFRAAASSSRISLTNGGHIYYPNYLGYNVSVSEVYLAKADASRYMAKQMTPSAMQIVIGKIPVVGDIYGLLDFATSLSVSRTFKQATAGKGTLKIFRSSDADGSAKVISYWSTSPYVTLYSGGRLNRK